MAHDVGRVDQTGYAGSDVQVADIRLRGADGAELLVFRVRMKRLSERSQFDGIAKRRPSSMRLNVTDGLRIHSGGFVGQRNDARLSFHTGRRVTNFRRTVVVRSKASNDGIDLVAVADCIFQPL